MFRWFMFFSRLIRNVMGKNKFYSFNYFTNFNIVGISPCLYFLLSCVRFCYLLYFQLKPRPYFRLLVLCFVWALLHFAGMVWHLCLLPLQRCCCSKLFFLKGRCHVVLCLYFWDLLVLLNWFHWTQEVASLCLTHHFSLSVSALTVSVSLSDGVWFAVLNFLPSHPSLALLTNSRNLLRAEPAL